VITPNGKAYATYVRLDRTFRLGIFGVLMRGIVGIPISDETLLVFTASLIFQPEVDPLPAFASGFLGSICSHQPLSPLASYCGAPDRTRIIVKRRPTSSCALLACPAHVP